MKQKILLILVFIFVVPFAFSVPLENLVSAAHAAQLRSSGELVMEVQLRNSSPRLLPQNGELRQFFNEIRSTLGPGMMVETMYLYRKPAHFHTSVNIWDDRQKLQIFNQILAISTLTGIQYFSASRNAMRTLYDFSGIIDGPQTRNPLPDPVFSQLPQTLTQYARKRDLTFGDNIYRYSYVSTPDAVFFVQENLTSMNYGIIPAIGRGNLRSVVALIDCGDSVLIYVVSMTRAVSLPGMGDRISNSFKNRAEAVLNWLTGRLNSQIFFQ